MENKTPNKLCARCGKILNGNAKFCPKCGQAVEYENKENEVGVPQKRTCPQCGGILSGDVRFCSKCGQMVEGIVKNNEQFQPIEKRCSQCGTLINKNAKFCPKCGQPMEEILNTGEDGKVLKSKKKKTKKIVGILATVIVCIITLCVISSIVFNDRLSAVEIGDALGRDSMQTFLSENDYVNVSSGMYESPDKQVGVSLNEKGIPEQVIISGGNTKIFGIGIGDTFTLEKTGRTLASRGYGYVSEDEMSITYATEVPGGFTKSITLFLGAEDNKIYNIIYTLSDDNETVEGNEKTAIGNEGLSADNFLEENGIAYNVLKDTFLWEDMKESVVVCEVKKDESIIVTDDCGNGWFYAIYGDDFGFIRGEDFKSSDKVDEEVNAELFEDYEQELPQGTYIYDDGSSVYSTVYIIEDANGLRIDINAMGYGGHQQGLANGYLIGLGAGTYSCIDEGDSGTFILKITDDGFDITAHPASGMEVMFSSIEGHYVYSGFGNAKADGYFEEDWGSEPVAPVGIDEPYYSDSGDTMDEPQIMIADSSTRLLTDADVYWMTPNQLRIAINEIYARHGRRFTDAELQAWFDSQAWYQGTVLPENFNENVLSQIEKDNIKVLQNRKEVNSR